MNYHEIAQRLTNTRAKVTASVASTGTVYFRVTPSRGFRDLTVRLSNHPANPDRPITTSQYIEVATIEAAKKQIFNFVNNN